MASYSDFLTWAESFFKTSAPSTYVLEGTEDPTQNFVRPTDLLYTQRNDVTIIRALYGISNEDASKQIKAKSNVIYVAHGIPENFEWRKDKDGNPEFIAYPDMLKHLPSDTHSVFITSCMGGTAQNFLASASAGSLVMTFTNEHTLSDGEFVCNFAKNTKGISNPVDLCLEVYNSFNPKKYQTDAMEWIKEGHTRDSNPVDALPNTIGFGGNPLLLIDLKAEMAAIRQGKSPAYNLDTAVNNPLPIEEKAWERAKIRVFKHLNAPLLYDVGQKMRENDPAHPIGESGDPVQDAKELRTAYALTVAYLAESGQMDRWRESQIAYSKQVRHELGALELAVEDNSQKITPANITPEINKELQAFAANFSIALPKNGDPAKQDSLDLPSFTNGKLTEQDIKAIQTAVHVHASGEIDRATLTNMEFAIEQASPLPGHTISAEKNSSIFKLG